MRHESRTDPVAVLRAFQRRYPDRTLPASDVADWSESDRYSALVWLESAALWTTEGQRPVVDPPDVLWPYLPNNDVP